MSLNLTWNPAHTQPTRSPRAAGLLQSPGSDRVCLLDLRSSAVEPRCCVYCLISSLDLPFSDWRQSLAMEGWEGWVGGQQYRGIKVEILGSIGLSPWLVTSRKAPRKLPPIPYETRCFVPTNSLMVFVSSWMNSWRNRPGGIEADAGARGFAGHTAVSVDWSRLQRRLS